MVMGCWRHALDQWRIPFVQHVPGKLDRTIEGMNVCHRLLELARQFLEFVGQIFIGHDMRR